MGKKDVPPEVRERQIDRSKQSVETGKGHKD